MDESQGGISPFLADSREGINKKYATEKTRIEEVDNNISSLYNKLISVKERHKRKNLLRGKKWKDYGKYKINHEKGRRKFKRDISV